MWLVFDVSCFYILRRQGMKRLLKPLVMSMIVGFVGAGSAMAEDIKLRIASGHPAANTYVNLMQNFLYLKLRSVLLRERSTK